MTKEMLCFVRDNTSNLQTRIAAVQALRELTEGIKADRTEWDTVWIAYLAGGEG